jgi:DNA-binding LytR/AlgR family response regulator
MGSPITADRHFLVSLRIANLETRFPNPLLLRAHRSHIVNLDHVECMVSLADSRLEVS